MFGPTNATLLATINQLRAEVASQETDTRTQIRGTSKAILNALAGVAGAIDRLTEEIIHMRTDFSEERQTIRSGVAGLAEQVQRLAASYEKIAEAVKSCDHTTDEAEFQQLGTQLDAGVAGLKTVADQLEALVIVPEPPDDTEVV